MSTLEYRTGIALFACDVDVNLDARYEKVRQDSQVRDAAVLIAAAQHPGTLHLARRSRNPRAHLPAKPVSRGLSGVRLSSAFILEQDEGWQVSGRMYLTIREEETSAITQ